MQRFENKVVIVTDSSSGFGLVSARACAREGTHVTLCARDKGKREQANTGIKNGGGSVAAVALELSDTERFKALIESTAIAHGRLDALVNNAAVIRHGMIGTMSLEQWRKNLSVTVDAAFTGTKTAMEMMNRQGQGIYR